MKFGRLIGEEHIPTIKFTLLDNNLFHDSDSVLYNEIFKNVKIYGILNQIQDIKKVSFLPGEEQ